MLKAALKVLTFTISMALVVVAANIIAGVSARSLAPHLSTSIAVEYKHGIFYFDKDTSLIALAIAVLCVIALLIWALSAHGVFSKQRSNLAGRIIAPIFALIILPVAVLAATFGTAAKCGGPDIGEQSGIEIDVEKLRETIKDCEIKYGLRQAP